MQNWDKHLPDRTFDFWHLHTEKLKKTLYAQATYKNKFGKRQASLQKLFSLMILSGAFNFVTMDFPECCSDLNS